MSLRSRCSPVKVVMDNDDEPPTIPESPESVSRYGSPPSPRGRAPRAASFAASPLYRPRYTSPEAATRRSAGPPSRPRPFASSEAAARFGSPPSQPRIYTSPEAAARFGSPRNRPRGYTSSEISSPPSHPRTYISPEAAARLAVSPAQGSLELRRHHHHLRQLGSSPRSSPERSSHYQGPRSAPRTRNSLGGSSPAPATETTSIWERRKNATPSVVVYGNNNASVDRVRARTSSPRKVSTKQPHLQTIPPSPPSSRPRMYTHSAAFLVSPLFKGSRWYGPRYITRRAYVARGAAGNGRTSGQTSGRDQRVFIQPPRSCRAER